MRSKKSHERAHRQEEAIHLHLLFQVLRQTLWPVEAHKGWIEDIKAYNKLDTFSYPIIADEDRSIATTYGMMDPDERDAKGLPLTCRAVFIIGPDK